MLPDLPGQVLHLNVDKRKAWITDRVATDEFKEQREQYIAAGRTLPIPKEFSFDNYKAEIVLNTLSVLEAARWQYWMRRLVDDGHANLIQGNLPDLKACRAALNGNIPGPNFTDGHDDIYRSVEEVHERRMAQRAVATAAP